MPDTNATLATPAALPADAFAAAREHFPALALEQDGRPVVYADNPGGTQVPRACIEAIAAYLTRSNANTGGAFVTSRHSDAMLDEVHAATADLLNAADPREIVFGPNMTTLTFALSRAIGRTLRPGDEIVVTALDHDANVAPWQALAEERGAVVRMADVQLDTCTLDMDDLRAKITGRTRVVAVGYASNAAGTINDVATVLGWAREVGALSFVDAVQYAPHGPIDVQALGCDFLTCSSYKFFGPHLGILYGRLPLLEELPAYKVRPATDEPPGKWETGTQTHECLAGLLGTYDYLAALGRQHIEPQASTGRDERASTGRDERASTGRDERASTGRDERASTGRPYAERFASMTGRRLELHAALAAIQAHERELAAQLLAGLATIPGVHVYGLTAPEDLPRRVPTVMLTVAGHTPRALAEGLAARGIFAWDGNYYALNIMERLGLEPTGGALRIGLAHYNTPAEVERIVAALREVVGA